MNSIRTIRIFLLAEALGFFAAALVHSGVLARGFEHAKAATAETVIGSALALGLAAGLLRPASARAAGLVAQGFALAGTCVGLFTIAIGIGPRTAPDLAFHVAIVAVLIAGLTWGRASRRPRAA
jgi:hypothetical protein